MGELCGCRSGLLRRSRKPRREGPFVDLERPRPAEPYEPLVRGPQCRLDAGSHLRLVGFGCDEQRAESGDLARGIDCVVVWPPAQAVVSCCSAELPGHCGADGCWISSLLQRDRRFVNEGDALACPRAGDASMHTILFHRPYSACFAPLFVNRFNTNRRDVRPHASSHVPLPPLPEYETAHSQDAAHRTSRSGWPDPELVFGVDARHPSTSRAVAQGRWPRYFGIAAVDPPLGVAAWVSPVDKVVTGDIGRESSRDKTQAVHVSCPLVASSKQADGAFDS